MGKICKCHTCDGVYERRKRFYRRKVDGAWLDFCSEFCSYLHYHSLHRSLFVKCRKCIALYHHHLYGFCCDRRYSIDVYNETVVEDGILKSAELHHSSFPRLAFRLRSKNIDLEDSRIICALFHARDDPHWNYCDCCKRWREESIMDNEYKPTDIDIVHTTKEGLPLLR